MKKTFVIGDIHGGLKAIPQILERANVAKKDVLIFLGDYVDGWSQSAETINYLIELSSNYSCIFIKGNHDISCENWLKNSIIDHNWLIHGGQQTIKSYRKLSSKEKLDHIDFFEKMIPYYIDNKNRLFIHAGFTSMKGPEQEFYSSNYTWDRTLWEMALSTDPKLVKTSTLFPKRLLLFKEIFIGHTPTIHFGKETPMQGRNVWNIDTGAAFTGRLSIMDVDSKDFWQSDKLMMLYPNESGRNKHIVNE